MGSSKTPSNRRLKTMEDVRRFLADITNRLNRDDIEPAKAGKLGYLCGILVRVIEGGELERRVDALEAAIRDGGKRP